MSEYILKNSNFSWAEATYSQTANRNAILNPINKWLVEHMVQYILQPIRNEFGIIKITSWIRDKMIWDSLYFQNYKPSKTTDHSYLDPQLNQYGVGAVDFIPYEALIKEVYKWIYKKIQSKEMYVGQLIIYPDRDIPFIHISNPKELVFSRRFLVENDLDIKDINKFLVEKIENGERKFIPYRNSSGKMAF